MVKKIRKKYSKQEFIDLLDTYEHSVSDLYRAFLDSKKIPANYKGCTRDTREFYTEIAADWVLKRLELFDKIEKTTRNNNYNLNHDYNETDVVDKEISEENLAKNFFLQSKKEKFNVIGKVIDFQTPLKNAQVDTHGKIDMMAYDGKNLYLIELKNYKNDKNYTMLSCVMEIYAYSKIVDVNKLLEDFNLPKDTNIILSPLVYYGGSIHKRYHFNEMKNLRKLMKKLNIKPLFYEISDDGKISVMEDYYNEN